MWKSLRVLGLAKSKVFFQFMNAMMLCILSGYSIAAESTSTCWVYGGLGRGGGYDLIDYSTRLELEKQRWPDPQTALNAFAEAAANRFLGSPCFNAYGFVRGTVSQMQKSSSYPSNFTSGRVGDPGTGIPIGYEQSVGFMNEFGEFCSGGSSVLGTNFLTLDGSYYGRSQCQQNYSIKLSPLSGSAESGTILTSIEPDKSTGVLVAKVYDHNGQLVPNAKVKLVVDVQRYSGGHQHDEGRHSNSLNENHVGRLAPYLGTTATVSENGKVLEGNTKQDGLRFSFKSPASAGDHKIMASCTDGKNCTPQGPDTVWVGIKDLISLPDSDVYVLLPNVNDPKHPDNHYMTYTAMLRVTVLAALYHGEFPDDPLLHLNDASLERGGVFDFKYEGRSIWWTPPHFEHCRGTEIDIRANLSDGAIPESNFPEFDRIAKRVGADPVRECKADENKQCIVSTRHYHVRLTGGKPQCP